jgi:membrane protein DedA with SNARE-associated domain
MRQPTRGLPNLPELDRPPKRWQRRVVVGFLALSLTASVIGNTLTPVLLRESPLLLLGIQSSYAQMALASVRVEALTFVLLAGFRRWAGDLIAFSAGRVLGVEVLDWYRRRSGSKVRLPTQLNDRWWWARDAAVVLIPHSLFSAFFGVVKMPIRRFVILKGIGSFLVVTVMWYLMRVAGLPVDTATTFVETNAVVLTVGAVSVGGGWWLWQQRSGGQRPRNRPDPAPEPSPEREETPDT